MIKTSVKNFFKCFKYFFTPLGTLFLGVAIGLFVFFSGTAAAVNGVITEINALSSEISLNFGDMAEKFLSIVGESDWSNPLETISEMFSRDWLYNAMTECLNALIGVNYGEYMESVASVITVFIESMVGLVVVFAIFAILGFIGGYFLTKFLIRHTIARRAWWKFFLSALIDSLLSAAVIIVAVLLSSLWKPSILISSLILLILFGLASFVEAYLIHAYKKLKFTEVLNAKNVLLLIASNIIIVLIALAITIAAYLLLGGLLGTILGITLFEIAMITISMNAESYVKDRADAAAV